MRKDFDKSKAIEKLAKYAKHQSAQPINAPKFNPHIDYSIRINGSEEITKVKIPLTLIEENGLDVCLATLVPSTIFNAYEIVYRKIHMTHDPNFEQNRTNAYSEHYYGNKKQNKTSKNRYNDKEYRVFLGDLTGLPENAPESVDVKAESARNAIVRALHSIKVFNFPKGWENAGVTQPAGKE